MRAFSRPKSREFTLFFSCRCEQLSNPRSQSKVQQKATVGSAAPAITELVFQSIVGAQNSENGQYQCNTALRWSTQKQKWPVSSPNANTCLPQLQLGRCQILQQRHTFLVVVPSGYVQSGLFVQVFTHDGHSQLYQPFQHWQIATLCCKVHARIVIFVWSKCKPLGLDNALCENQYRLQAQKVNTTGCTRENSQSLLKRLGILTSRSDRNPKLHFKNSSCLRANTSGASQAGVAWLTSGKRRSLQRCTGCQQPLATTISSSALLPSGEFRNSPMESCFVKNSSFVIVLRRERNLSNLQQPFGKLNMSTFGCLVHCLLPCIVPTDDEEAAAKTTTTKRRRESQKAAPFVSLVLAFPTLRVSG